jgi:hypothetical protein
LAVRAPNGFVVEPPAFQKDLGSFELRSSTALPARVEGDETVASFRAELQNFATGPQLLPGIEVSYQELRGGVHAVKTPAQSVLVTPVPPGPKDQEGQIRGIKGVIGPTGWSPWWWALLALLLLGGGVFAWHRRQRVLHGPPPEPPVPADEEALSRLAALKNSGWIEAGKPKEFYSRLSEIVRAYLERGFRLPALERTTSELVRDLARRQDFDPGVKASFRTLFEACDLVKFAKFRPDAEEAMKDYAAALDLVQKTRPREAPPA